MFAAEMNSPDEFGKKVAECLKDSMVRMKEIGGGRVGVTADMNPLDVEIWRQSWPNTNCGFGGIAGQAISSAPTIVVSSLSATLSVVVYHAGRFAYSIKQPNDLFYEARNKRQLMGAKDYTDQYEKK